MSQEKMDAPAAENPTECAPVEAEPEESLEPARQESREAPPEAAGAVEEGPEEASDSPFREEQEAASVAEAQREEALAHLRQRAREHLDSLRAQAEELRRDFPDFTLDAALRDPDFLRLTAPGLGVDLRRAYYALHREELDGRAARQAAEETRSRMLRSLTSFEGRPREGGGQQAAAQLAADYRSLSRGQQQALKQRIIEAAARGEKIYP